MNCQTDLITEPGGCIWKEGMEKLSLRPPGTRPRTRRSPQPTWPATLPAAATSAPHTPRARRPTRPRPGPPPPLHSPEAAASLHRAGPAGPCAPGPGPRPPPPAPLQPPARREQTGPGAGTWTRLARDLDRAGSEGDWGGGGNALPLGARGPPVTPPAPPPDRRARLSRGHPLRARETPGTASTSEPPRRRPAGSRPAATALPAVPPGPPPETMARPPPGRPPPHHHHHHQPQHGCRGRPGSPKSRPRPGR